MSSPGRGSTVPRPPANYSYQGSGATPHQSAPAPVVLLRRLRKCRRHISRHPPHMGRLISRIPAARAWHRPCPGLRPITAIAQRRSYSASSAYGAARSNNTSYYGGNARSSYSANSYSSPSRGSYSAAPTPRRAVELTRLPPITGRAEAMGPRRHTPAAARQVPIRLPAIRHPRAAVIAHPAAVAAIGPRAAGAAIGPRAAGGVDIAAVVAVVEAAVRTPAAEGVDIVN